MIFTYNPLTNELNASPNSGGGGGGVSSVGFIGDGVVFNTSVPGSPITTSGSFAPTLVPQSANTILVGPTTGVSAAPTFRALVNSDLPTNVNFASIGGATPGTGTFSSLINTGQYLDSGNSSASAPAMYNVGTWFVGGTGTTNFPHFLIQPTGATPVTTWNTTGGTAIGINSISFTGKFIDCYNNGSTAFSVNSSGLLTANSNIVAGAVVICGVNSGFLVSGRSQFKSSANGLIELFNAAATGFTRLNFGGITSSFPALKVNGTGLSVRLADDSADTSLTAASLALGKTITPSGTTGNQTINKPVGTVNFAALAVTLVVTNSLVTTNSVISLQIAANDSSCNYINYTPGNGSFTINAPTPPAAEMRVDFIIIN